MIDEPQPDAPPPAAPVWLPFAALLGVLVVVGTLGAALIGVVAAADPTIDADDLPPGLSIPLLALQNVVFIFAAWIAVRLVLGRTPPEQFGLVPVARPWHAVAWAAAVFAAFWLVLVVLTQIAGQPEDQALLKDVKEEDSLAVLIPFGAVLCVLGPFAEELFFRGFMFTILYRRLGLVWAALIDGALFGLGHAPAEPIQIVALVAFGIGLCILYARTRSIIPCMALHALNNSITFAVATEADPALAAGVIVISVGTLAAAGTALSSRSTVTA